MAFKLVIVDEPACRQHADKARHRQRDQNNRQTIVSQETHDQFSFDIPEPATRAQSSPTHDANYLHDFGNSGPQVQLAAAEWKETI